MTPEDAKPYPIMSSYLRSIPWGVLMAHERQAQRNHSQTLARLAERGGLAPWEAVCIIRDEDYRGPTFTLPKEREARDAFHRQAAEELAELVRRWEAERLPAVEPAQL